MKDRALKEEMAAGCGKGCREKNQQKKVEAFKTYRIQVRYY